MEERHTEETLFMMDKYGINFEELALAAVLVSNDFEKQFVQSYFGNKPTVLERTGANLNRLKEVGVIGESFAVPDKGQPIPLSKIPFAKEFYHDMRFKGNVILSKVLFNNIKNK